ncbi:rRNA processing protein [Basidiobolus ranarum]|uniref:Pre-rRNA-processing protein n=1 Tax=Basidiobolus ranarum TaxID=34480 RepID=A0ABR2W4N9_9FUNG
MPKTSSRKKKQKNVDFQKTKLKVGKKKVQADNFTDTSFKSRAVSLPNQSIALDKTNELTNVRNQSLNELIPQLKHYSSAVRKDAIHGTQDLLNRHPHVLRGSLGTLINTMTRLLVDDDEAVRKGVHTFFSEFLPQLDQSDLHPFLPLLIVYTCSAMTHIHEDIRTDALKFLNLWIDISPQTVIKYSEKIIPNYISLLNVDSTTANTTKITTASAFALSSSRSQLGYAGSKISTMNSLYKFLEIKLKYHDSSRDAFWFLSDYVGGSKNASMMDTESNTVSWKPDSKNSITVFPHAEQYTTMPSYSHLNLFDTSNKSTLNKSEGQTVGGISHDTDDVEVESIQMLEILNPFLLSTWLEASPNVFTATGSVSMTPSLEAVYLVLKLMRVLWRTGMSGNTIRKVKKKWIEEHLQLLLKHFMIHFPFGNDALGIRDAKVESVLQDMNSAFCELTSLFLISLNSHDEKNSIFPKWADRVYQHILSALGEELEKVETNMTTQTTDFKPEHFIALMPSIWTFLNSLETERQEILFKALMSYGNRSHINSITKKLALEFLTRILTIQNHPQYAGSFIVGESAGLTSAVKVWILSLPKTLWALRSNSPNTSRVILRALRDLINQDKSNLFDSSFHNSLQLNLVPFFHVTVPNKGPIFGPFNSLPEDLQRLTIELLYYLGKLNDRILRSINACTEASDFNVTTKIYLDEVMNHFN